MDEKLLEEAQKYGINTSMYNLLPSNKREAVLRDDIARARKRREETNGQNKQTQSD